MPNSNATAVGAPSAREIKNAMVIKRFIPSPHSPNANIKHVAINKIIAHANTAEIKLDLNKSKAVLKGKLPTELA